MILVNICRHSLKFLFFLVVRPFKIYYLNNFQTCNTVLLTSSHHAIHYILLTCLFYVCVFNLLHPFCYPQCDYFSVSSSLLLYCWYFLNRELYYKYFFQFIGLFKNFLVPCSRDKYNFYVFRYSVFTFMLLNQKDEGHKCVHFYLFNFIVNSICSRV